MSKRIQEISKQSKLFGVIPYIDPKKLANKKTYSLNEKSDVYSIGVLSWEISSGQPPFLDESYDVNLAIQIAQGLRETIVSGTPIDYFNLYTGKYNLLN